jgi:hypothetical protein
MPRPRSVILQLLCVSYRASLHSILRLILLNSYSLAFQILRTSIPLQFKRTILEVKMSGFPSLQPAFTVRVGIDAPMQVGGQAGAQLVIVPMVSGTVKSEEGFEPVLDGKLYVSSSHSQYPYCACLPQGKKRKETMLMQR